MTTPHTAFPTTKTVDPRQVAKALQDLGYRGLVDESGCRVLSAAMGFDFRVLFYRPVETDDRTEFENYLFDMGTFFSFPISMPRAIAYCNELNAEYRYAKFYIGQSSEGRCFAVVQMDIFADGTDEESVRRNCEMFLSFAGTFRALVTRIENHAENAALDEHGRAVELIHGSEEERVQAAELYHAAACRGFAGAQNNFGDLYERGLVVPASTVAAAYWYARAAERGEPTAYLSLASLLFASGEDNWTLIEAMKFALLACDHLNDGTRKKTTTELVEKLRSVLPEESIDFARRLANSWLPLFQETRLMSDPQEAARPEDVLLN